MNNPESAAQTTPTTPFRAEPVNEGVGPQDLVYGTNPNGIKCGLSPEHFKDPLAILISLGFMPD